METKHTPTPYFTLHEDGVVYTTEKTGEHTSRLKSICRGASNDDAAFIVRAVNSHDPLVKALSDLANHVNDSLWQLTNIAILQNAMEALAKARGV